jgi:hypothetical protein
LPAKLLGSARAPIDADAHLFLRSDGAGDETRTRDIQLGRNVRGFDFGFWETTV